MDTPCSTCLARQSDLCSVFQGDEVDKLYRVAQRITVDAGGYLLHEEDPRQYVYNIADGVGALERLASDGHKQVMAFLYPGDFIGFDDEGVYSVSARALQPLSACSWHVKDLERLGEESPELKARIHKIAVHILARTMDQIFVLGRKNAVEKIAYFLLYIHERQMRLGTRQDEFQLPMTRADVADYLGITMETVSRSLSRLKKTGCVDLTINWSVRIIDHDRLAEIADYFPK